MAVKPTIPPGAAEMRRRAEERLRTKAPALPEVDPPRILHELQVHQIQLEMQNEELRDARSHLEDLVEKYTDLYDFAPMGYFSLDNLGRIQQVNLPGAAMLGIERSKLLQRRFSGFVLHRHRSSLETFLRNVFEGKTRQVCELALELVTKETVWVDLQAMMTVSTTDGQPLCRLAVLDITERKRATEALLRVEALETMNTALENEISRRKKVEKSLRESRQNQSILLSESKRMEEALRMLSHQILHSQEEERKRISHDLHDEIAQTLVAINVHLAHLARGAASEPGDISEKIVATQKLVEHSVESVHRFAMALRPSHLDDFGFLPALKCYIKEYTRQSRIPVQLAGTRKMKPLEDTSAVVLFRVAQAALTNVAQHANATQVKVDIRQTQRSVIMIINDDGKSFDAKKALTGTKINRLGLIGMRERVEMVGGKFAITSSPDQGTTICVTLPFAKESPPTTTATTRGNP
jgi:PAS domain S-box-containing protein